MSINKLFEKDVLRIYDLLEIGHIPVLSDAEKIAVDRYPMKKKAALTPLLK